MGIENRNSPIFCTMNLCDLQRDVFAAEDPFHANFLVARNQPSDSRYLNITSRRIQSVTTVCVCIQGILNALSSVKARSH